MTAFKTKLVYYVVMTLALVLIPACGGGGNTPGGPKVTATHFSISAPSTSSTGLSFAFRVTAKDASNNAVSDYAGTVKFTSSDTAASLPANSTLTNGNGTFSASLSNAGLQSIAVADVSSPTLKGTASISVSAAEFPVGSFGAKGDGRSDDTASIQAAINAAGAAGGGSVVLGIGRYLTAGTLVLPRGVILCGAAEGPFDVGGISPGNTTIAPTLLVTSTSGPFITLQGIGSGVTDVLFHYPNQAPSTAATPTVYPYTIQVTAPGTKIARITVTNAYNFLDIEVGRVIAQDLFIGALNTGINIDHAADHITLRHIFNQVFWDVVENASYPSLIDNWVLSHATGLIVGRADSLEIHDFFVFTRFMGILLTDSSDTSQTPSCGYGTGSDIDLDWVGYGIVISASNSPGYKFTNVDIGASQFGQAAVQVRSGGSLPPKIEINGGSQRGDWTLGAYPPSGANTIIVNILP